VPTFRHTAFLKYKANRPTQAERRLRQRERVCEASDPPLTWMLPVGRALDAPELSNSHLDQLGEGAHGNAGGDSTPSMARLT
jgi:hypothetical protein